MYSRPEPPICASAARPSVGCVQSSICSSMLSHGMPGPAVACMTRAVAADHDDLDLSSCFAGTVRADAQQLDDDRSHAPPLVEPQGVVIASKDSYHDVSRF